MQQVKQISAAHIGSYVNQLNYFMTEVPITGLSKFHFDVHVSLLKFVQVKYIWVHIRAREVFETVILLLGSL